MHLHGLHYVRDELSEQLQHHDDRSCRDDHDVQLQHDDHPRPDLPRMHLGGRLECRHADLQLGEVHRLLRPISDSLRKLLSAELRPGL